jgi:hypothetical protein
MILSHKHEFIFICNGKTGTSSVEAVLNPYQEGADFEVGIDGLYTPKHVPPSTLRAQLGPDIWDEYFTFMFVRNPWDWFVSQYFWNHEPNPISKKKLIREPVTTLREYQRKNEERARLEDLDRFSPQDIHETYDLLRRYRAVYQADSLFQYHYAYSPNGEKLVDFVGRFERINEDFSQAMTQVGLNAKLPHRNSTSHRDYRAYYTPETADLIGNLYRVDVNAFDYTRPKL